MAPSIVIKKSYFRATKTSPLGPTLEVALAAFSDIRSTESGALCRTSPSPSQDGFSFPKEIQEFKLIPE